VTLLPGPAQALHIAIKNRKQAKFGAAVGATGVTKIVSAHDATSERDLNKV
jgi:hypothetical protein